MNSSNSEKPLIINLFLPMYHFMLFNNIKHIEEPVPILSLLKGVHDIANDLVYTEMLSLSLCSTQG